MIENKEFELYIGADSGRVTLPANCYRLWRLERCAERNATDNIPCFVFTGSPLSVAGNRRSTHVAVERVVAIGGMD